MDIDVLLMNFSVDAHLEALLMSNNGARKRISWN